MPNTKPSRHFEKPHKSPAKSPRRGGPGAPKRFGHRANEEDIIRIFGIHAVEAALANPARVIRRALMTENAENRLQPHIVRLGLAVERASPQDLDRLLGADTVHQGALLECEPLPEPDLADLVLGAEGDAAAHLGPALLLVLDQVTDPHNVGAVLRSAAVFGASGVVMTRRNSPPLSGALAKAASGALELVRVARIPNLSQGLAVLEEMGVQRIGLDGAATLDLEDAPGLAGPVALVLGAEGRGLRELTRTTCDVLCRIGTPGPLASLNVSNAAAVGLHIAARARRRAGTSAPQK